MTDRSLFAPPDPDVPHTVRRLCDGEIITVTPDPDGDLTGHRVSITRWLHGWGAWCHGCDRWLLHTGPRASALAAARDHLGFFVL